MKWLFALLLLLNAGFWMWGAWYKGLATDEVKQARTPINPEQMRLLSEPGVNPHPRPVAAPTVEPLTPADPHAAADKEKPKVCYTFGPFNEQAAALNVGSNLKTLKFDFTPRTESQRIIAGYRVFLAPFASVKAAQAKRVQLSKLGITDHALIPDSEKHAISLGFFSQEDKAKTYVKQLVKKGIKAQSETLYTLQPQYWLDIQPQNSSQPPVLDNLTRIKGAANAHLSEVACPNASAVNSVPSSSPMPSSQAMP